MPGKSYRLGVTLVELMVAMAIMSIGVLGMVGAYRYINLGIQAAKTRSLANNIAQERIEFLKNKSYYRLMVTTATASDANFDPPLVYDNSVGNSETVNVGGIDFIRRVYIRKVNEDASGDLTYLSWNDPDPGLKEVKIYVTWFERGEWRKLEVRNLRENPARVNQSASISGNVTDASGGANLSSVTVKAQESPSNYGFTGSDGNYSFSIEPGSYTLLAVKDGYFSRTLPKFPIASGQAINGKDLQLVRMSSGTISGTAYLRDHMVIYMVVGSTVMTNGDDVEFVSLYNPTTAQITMWTGSANAMRLGYYGETGASQDHTEFWLQYYSSSVPSGHHFLVASTGSFRYNGYNMTADAVYTPANVPDCSVTPNGQLDCIRIDKAGAVTLKDSANKMVDALGWCRSAVGKNAPLFEGTQQCWGANGLELGGQFFRFTMPWSGNALTGSCYDTNVNNSNFFYFNYGLFPTMNLATGYKEPRACTPAAGAFAFADDGLSSPVIAESDGDFSIVSVATGTSWTVYVASGVIYSSFPAAGGTANGYSSSMGTVFISSETTYGFVSGRVADVFNTPLSGIKMYSSGSPQLATGSDGRYTLPVLAGVANVTANYQAQNPIYVEVSSMDISVSIGQIKKDVDFALYQGGKISGRVTTNGTDALPGIPVSALKEGVEHGSAISGLDGNFLIWGSGISTGTYGVVPQLELGEGSTPSSATITVTPGATAFSAIFTVTGAPGTFTGTVRTGSSSGPVITTGVLIYITTATIVATPPTVNSALRSGAAVYYAGSSNARGEYSIPVKGGFSYNVYAWYTTWSGADPIPVMKSSTAITINPSETKTVDFFW